MSLRSAREISVVLGRSRADYFCEMRIPIMLISWTCTIVAGMGNADPVPGSRFPLAPQISSSVATYVRYCFEGGTLNRDGRLIPVVDTANEGIIRGSDLLGALRADGVEVEDFDVRCYDSTQRGWAELKSDVTFLPDGEVEPSRVDVQLFRPQTGQQSALEAPPGFFTIGAVGIKNSQNLGTLWRSAYQMGAATIFTVGGRYEPQASDTVKCWRSTPLVRHEDWNAFAAAAPYGAQWVAVEFGGEPLETFVHPERACYILGAEDTGLPESILRACHKHVTLPSVQYESFNLAVAGSLVLYDRLAKERLKGQSK